MLRHWSQTCPYVNWHLRTLSIISSSSDRTITTPPSCITQLLRQGRAQNVPAPTRTLSHTLSKATLTETCLQNCENVSVASTDVPRCHWNWHYYSARLGHDSVLTGAVQLQRVSQVFDFFNHWSRWCTLGLQMLRFQRLLRDYQWYKYTTRTAPVCSVTLSLMTPTWTYVA